MRGLVYLSIVLLVIATTGCAWSTYRDYRESRKAAAECEELHGAEAPECEALRAQERRDYERYEGEARTGWGCTAGGPEGDCPTPR